MWGCVSVYVCVDGWIEVYLPACLHAVCICVVSFVKCLLVNPDNIICYKDYWLHFYMMSSVIVWINQVFDRSSLSLVLQIKSKKD